MFAEDCIRQFNDTPTMKKVILSAVDPRDFMGTTVYDKETKQEKPANLQDAVYVAFRLMCCPSPCSGSPRLLRRYYPT
jgi:hypothetical protein